MSNYNRFHVNCYLKATCNILLSNIFLGRPIKKVFSEKLNIFTIFSQPSRRRQWHHYIENCISTRSPKLVFLIASIKDCLVYHGIVWRVVDINFCIYRKFYQKRLKQKKMRRDAYNPFRAGGRGSYMTPP